MKVIMSIEEIIKAKAAIDALMTLKGLHRKQAYWLDKNRQKMQPALKKWIALRDKIFDSFCIEIPSVGYIPYHKYPEVRKELLNTLEKAETVASARNQAEAILVCNEVENDAEEKGKMAIPIEKQSEYEKAVAKAALEFNEELEFDDIQLDINMEQIMKALPGEFQLALDFMFKDVSSIQVFPGGLNS